MAKTAEILDLVYRESIRSSASVISRNLVVRLFAAAYPFLGLPKGKSVELGVVVVGPTRMRSLNREWRKIDKPTDVLSFPLPRATIARYTAISLGDIFICPMVVRAKAKLWKRSPAEQMKWTIVHGLLHLAGHDHEKSAKAAARMASLERKILGA
jgi:probable rRNA maturation factor